MGSEYIKAILALLFVIGLIGLISYLLKRFSFDKAFSGGSNKVKRISIEEVRPLDTKRRLIIVKKDNKEHLILMGANSDLLIETSDAITREKEDAA